MTDLHARETELPDWDGPVEELVEEERVVGVVYTDEGSLMAELYADEDGEPWVFEVADLQRVLDTAAAMLGLGEEPATMATPTDVHAVDRLAEEFDAKNGGFGRRPKFPPHNAFAALFSEYRRTKKQETLAMATRTLDAMAMGGMAYLIGDPEGAPLRISVPQAYFHGSAHACVGMLNALTPR